MQRSSLFRLGGMALFLAALVYAMYNVQKLVTGQVADTTLTWLVLFGYFFQILGITAVFVAQADRGGLLGLVGFVMLIFGYLAGVGEMTLHLVVAEGAVTHDQLQAAPTMALAGEALPYLFHLGLVLFGAALYRGGVFPKYAGALVALLGPIGWLHTQVPFLDPVHTVLYTIAWVWLGWALWRGQGAPRPVVMKPAV